MDVQEKEQLQETTSHNCRKTINTVHRERWSDAESLKYGKDRAFQSKSLLHTNKHEHNAEASYHIWRYYGDCSVVKHAHCSYRGSEFCSPQLHGGSQPPRTSAPGNLVALSDLHGVLHVCGIHTFKQIQYTLNKQS